MPSLPTLSTYSYAIDAANRITQVSPEWLVFARECGARLTEEQVVGRSLLSFISDDATRHIYRVMLERVRATGRPMVVPFRCDGPEVRRFMELAVAPGESGGLRLEGRLLREEIRDPVALFDPEHPRGEGLLTVCSWCKRVRVGQGWLEVEDAVTSLRLFDEPRLPRLTHGICPDCAAAMERELERSPAA
jgi:hypothetical protein